MLGILDSGVGGLSVWREVKKLFPNSGILYFADSARLPYGNLPKEKIFIYAKESIDHLIDLGATAIAIACHTIATNAIPLLKRSSPIPLLDIASHSLSLLEPWNALALLGTKATVSSHYYQRALASKHLATHACPELVPMIESGHIDALLVQAALKGIDRNIDALFLACTHFPLIKDVIAPLFPHIPVIDPAASFAKSLLPYTNAGKDEFFTTGDPAHFHRAASIFAQDKKVPSPFLIKSLYSPLLS